MIAVDTTETRSPVVRIVHLPPARQPLWLPFESIRAQFGSVEWAAHRTLHYNLATHAMAWCVALGTDGVVPLSELPDRIAGYPMPEGWRHSLDDATRLGLVGRARDEVTLTATGLTLRELIPQELEDLGSGAPDGQEAGHDLGSCVAKGFGGSSPPASA